MTDKDIQKIYSDYSFAYAYPRNHVDSIYFNNITPLQNYIKKYHVTIKDSNGKLISDATRNTYTPEKNGSVKLHLLDYNSGYGVKLGGTVEIEAIGADDRVMPLLPITIK